MLLMLLPLQCLGKAFRVKPLGSEALRSCLPPETSLLYPHWQDEDPTPLVDALVCSGRLIEDVAVLAIEHYSVSSSNTLTDRYHSPWHIGVHHFEFEAFSVSVLEVACQILDPPLMNCMTRCRSVNTISGRWLDVDARDARTRNGRSACSRVDDDVDPLMPSRWAHSELDSSLRTATHGEDELLSPFRTLPIDPDPFVRMLILACVTFPTSTFLEPVDAESILFPLLLSPLSLSRLLALNLAR